MLDVTVIIPVFNSERFLPEALDSLLAQTLPSEQFEVLCVNDGSTDGSLEILEAYAAAHSNVSVHTIPNSGSASAPRNFALDLADSEYVFFLDSDDKLSPDALEQLLSLAMTSGSDVVLGRMDNFGDGKPRPVTKKVFRRTRIAEDPVDCHAVRTLGPTKLFRRSLIEDHHLRFPLGYGVGEDQPFVMSAYLLANHVSAFSDHVLYWIRNHDTNISKQGQPPAMHLQKVLNLCAVVTSLEGPGERRNRLLTRPLCEGAGLPIVFGPAFLKCTAEAKQELVSKAQTLAQLWTQEMRVLAPIEVQATLDFLFREDIRALDQVALLRSLKVVAPVTYVPGGIAFRTPDGAVSEPLHRVPRVDLLSLAYEREGCSFVLEASLPIPGEAPLRVSAIWVNRRTKQEAAFPCWLIVDENVVLVGSSIARSDLPAPGTWDLFVQVDYGIMKDVARVGVANDFKIERNPVAVGSDFSATVYLTQFGNLSFDTVGERSYANRARVQLAAPETSVGRWRRFLQEGDIS